MTDPKPMSDERLSELRYKHQRREASHEGELSSGEIDELLIELYRLRDPVQPGEIAELVKEARARVYEDHKIPVAVGGLIFNLASALERLARERK